MLLGVELRLGGGGGGSGGDGGAGGSKASSAGMKAACYHNTENDGTYVLQQRIQEITSVLESRWPRQVFLLSLMSCISIWVHTCCKLLIEVRALIFSISCKQLLHYFSGLDLSGHA